MRFHLIPKLIPPGCRCQLITHEDQKLDYFSDETMTGSILEVLRRPWFSRIVFRPWISWEIEAQAESIKYFYWAPDTNIGEEVRNKILAYYPDIEIRPETKQLEIQNCAKGTRLRLRAHYCLTIKTFFNSIVDTQGPILNAMTGLKEGEKAYLQILLRPATGWRRKIKKAQKIVSKWTDDATTELIAKAIHGKTFKQLGEVELRIVAESQDRDRAAQIVRNISHSFGQFSSESLNALEAKEFTVQPLLIHDFKQRIYPFYTRKNNRRILNIEELSGLVRLPSKSIQIPQLLRLTMKKIPPPIDVVNMANEINSGRLGKKNINIGENVYLNLDSLKRHLMIFGATQMGKTVFIVNMLQDIMKLKLQGISIGFEVIEPHGSLCQDIAALVPPGLEDYVDYIKPAYKQGAFPFNLYDVDFIAAPDQISKSVVDALSRIWPQFWGPQIDDNLLLSGLALQKVKEANILNVRKLLSNKKDRKKIIGKLENFPDCEELAEFFKGLDVLPEKNLNERTNSTLNKLRQIEASVTLKNSLGQKNCGIQWRRSMDEGRITLIDLSELPDDEKKLYGSIALSRRYQAAMSRIDTEDRPLFLEVIDESAKFMSANEQAIESMADECRKFNLGLVCASQGMDEQIPDAAAAAILRNFGSLVAYRVPSPVDAQTLAQVFAHPEILPENIQKIDKNNAYMRLAYGRDTTKAFSCQLKAPEIIDVVKKKQRVEYFIEKTLARVQVDIQNTEEQLEIGEVEQELDIS